MTRLFVAVLALAFALGASARAASDGDEESSAPAPGKVFRAKGGPDKAAMPGGAVIINADGTRLEIAPTKRPPAETPAAARPAALSLPALPTLDNPKAPLPERKERALELLGASLAVMMILIGWARRRWRPGA